MVLLRCEQKHCCCRVTAGGRVHSWLWIPRNHLAVEDGRDERGKRLGVTKLDVALTLLFGVLKFQQPRSSFVRLSGVSVCGAGTEGAKKIGIALELGFKFKSPWAKGHNEALLW